MLRRDGFPGTLSHDDKATFGREQAFVIAKREVNSPSPRNISEAADVFAATATLALCLD